MLIRIFKVNNSILIVGLLLVASAFWIPSFFCEKETVFSGSPMPFYSLICSFFSTNKILSASVSIILIVTEAVLLNLIIQQFHLLKNQTYLPALVYVVLMSSIPEVLLLHPVLFANLFLILALKRSFGLLGNTNASSAAFDSAFFVSIGSLFYFPSILFLIFVWIALAAFRSFSSRDWLIAIIGIFVPYLFAGVYFFWFDESRQFWSETIFQPIINKVSNEIIFLKSFYAFLIFLSLMIVFSIPSFLSEMGRNKAVIRSGLRLFIWFGFFSVLSFFIATANALFHFCFAAIPLSIIFSNMFLNIKPVFSEIIFTLFLLLIIIYQLNYF